MGMSPRGAARDFTGEIIEKRGPKACFNTPYADFVETRLIELAKMGADGFYFDEVHMPKPFCCCANCRKAFQAETGLEYPAEPDPFDAAYQKAISFKNTTIERLFRRWRRAIHDVNPNCVLLVGSNTYPRMSDRHGTHRLYRIADVMKTEFNLPARGLRRGQLFETSGMARPETGAMMALGYAIARDATDGRPPHVWAHNLPNATHAKFATAGMIAHGCVANLDHHEADIPDRELFGPAVALGNRVAPALAGKRPLRWATVHYSEWARDHYMPDELLAWRKVLYPTYGAFTTLLHEGLPATVITDSQLEQGRLDGSRVLVLPAPKHLTRRMKEAVASFEHAGGTVIEQQPDWNWTEADAAEAAGAAMMETIAENAGTAPLRVTGGNEKMHAIPFAGSGGEKLTVALVNDFSWVFTGRRRDRQGKPIPGVEAKINQPPPSPCQDVAIHVAEERNVAAAHEMVTGKKLAVQKMDQGVTIPVPDFPTMAVVEIDTKP
ncbi:MAG: hypothetical protein ACODAD_10875 [Planctomycetota bacterium]